MKSHIIGLGIHSIRIFTLGICLALAAQAVAQGNISYNGGPIYVGQIGGPLASPANGPWLAALYAGPGGSPVSSLMNISGAPVSIGAITPGQITGTSIADPFPPQTTVSFQVRAWHASLGGTWEAIPGVQLDGSTPGTGLSIIVPAVVGGPLPLPNLGAFYPMVVSPIPEPTGAWLGVLGLTFLIFGRKHALP